MLTKVLKHKNTLLPLLNMVNKPCRCTNNYAGWGVFIDYALQIVTTLQPTTALLSPACWYYFAEQTRKERYKNDVTYCM